MWLNICYSLVSLLKHQENQKGNYAGGLFFFFFTIKTNRGNNSRFISRAKMNKSNRGFPILRQIDPLPIRVPPNHPSPSRTTYRRHVPCVRCQTPSFRFHNAADIPPRSEVIFTLCHRNQVHVTHTDTVWNAHTLMDLDTIDLTGVEGLSVRDQKHIYINNSVYLCAEASPLCICGPPAETRTHIQDWHLIQALSSWTDVEVPTFYLERM